MNVIVAAVLSISCFLPIAESTGVSSNQAQMQKNEQQVTVEEHVVPEDILQEADPLNQYSQEELDLMYKIVHAESKGESDLGQKAVTNVIINRWQNSSRFPNTLSGVVYQSGQFQPTRMRGWSSVRADERTKANVNAVLRGERVLPDNILFFNATWARGGGSRFYTRIGGHNFYA